MKVSYDFKYIVYSVRAYSRFKYPDPTVVTQHMPMVK